MSWGTCYSGSNNIHYDFPPIMSDGRNFANWSPGSVINERILIQNKILTNWDYRQHLTQNADSVIKQNQKEACGDCCTCGYNHTGKTSNTPYLYKSCVDSTQPYGYTDSNLKNLYLSRQQLQCRAVAPILTQEEYIRSQYPNPN
jgi:hypothetical protein